MNAGLSRELVLHSIVKAVRVVRADGTVFQFQNDPTNDQWLGADGPQQRLHCEHLQRQNAFHRPFTTNLWSGPHVRACVYQKFIYFLGAALAYGLTTEAQLVPNPLAAKDKSQPKVVSRVVLCFDPAVAQEYGRTLHPSLVCGSKFFSPYRPVFRDLGPNIKFVQPVMRSPYGVFQYYGRLLATDTSTRVKLFDAHTTRLPTGDASILTIRKGLGGDCFAQAQHAGESYCVPNKGANNTKEIFTLLNVLVNLSTSRSALPTTPTVQVTPQ